MSTAQRVVGRIIVAEMSIANCHWPKCRPNQNGNLVHCCVCKKLSRLKPLNFTLSALEQSSLLLLSISSRGIRNYHLLLIIRRPRPRNFYAVLYRGNFWPGLWGTESWSVPKT